MTSHQIAHLLLQSPDVTVYLCANVSEVDAVEEMPGDKWLKPYIVLHAGCKATATEFGVIHEAS